MELQLDLMGVDETFRNRFKEDVKSIWSLNGNAISHLYAGTGALESGSRITDAQRSISRTIKNNTSDSKLKFQKNIIIYQKIYYKLSFHN